MEQRIAIGTALTLHEEDGMSFKVNLTIHNLGASRWLSDDLPTYPGTEESSLVSRGVLTQNYNKVLIGLSPVAGITIVGERCNLYICSLYWER